MSGKRRRVIPGTFSGVVSLDRSPVTMPGPATYTDPTTGTVWTSIWEDDFATDYASVDQPYSSGVGWDPGAAGGANDGKLPTGNPYRNKFTSYPSTIGGTGGAGQYYSRKTMSTNGSRLLINMQRAVIPERTNTEADQDGIVNAAVPLGATFKPDLSPAGFGYYITYCRWQVAMRVTPTRGWYGGVWQQINSSNWPAYGEHDWPEGQYVMRLNSTDWAASDKNGPIHGFFHPAQATNTQIGFWPNGRNTAWDSGSYAENKWYQDWHVFTGQWEPVSAGVNRLRWWCDGVLALDRTAGVGGSPLVGLMYQCNQNASGYVPALATTCLVEIDWVKMWRHPSSV